MKLGMKLVLPLLAVLSATAAASAGEIQLAWDPASGAAGYRVYYGTSPGQYTGSVAVYGTSTTLTGLQNCTTYFVAVKAFNAAGESAEFSNELSGWARPAVATVTPTSAAQGDQLVMDIRGGNFQSGALVELSNPHVNIGSVSVLACDHIQLLATVEPTAKRIRPAKIGKLDLTVSNPDDVFGFKSNGFEVMINPARFDINQSDDATRNRIDGKDTVYISREFGKHESDPNYDPDDDFDGDGWVDGQDLVYIASNLGRCWSPSAKTWSVANCPSQLQ